MRRRDLLLLSGFMLSSGCLRLSNEGNEETPLNSPMSDTQTDTGAPTPTPEASTLSTNTASSTDSETPTKPQKTANTNSFPVGMSSEGVSGLFAEGYRDKMATLPSYTTSFISEHVSVGKTTIDHYVKNNQFALMEGTKERAFKEFWKGNRGTGQIQHRDNTLYTDHFDVYGFPLNQFTRFNYVKAHLSAGNYSQPELTTVDGQEVFKTRSSTIADPSPIYDLYSWGEWDEVASFSARLQARPDSTIKRIEAEVQLVQESELSTLTFVLESKDIGSTNVSEPEWLSKAQERAPQLSSELRGDHLVVNHDGGQHVPRETVLRLKSDSEYSGASKLDHDLTNGDTLWIWRGDGQFNFSHGEPGSSSPEPLSTRDVVQLRLFPIVLWIVEIGDL